MYTKKSSQQIFKIWYNNLLLIQITRNLNISPLSTFISLLWSSGISWMCHKPCQCCCEGQFISFHASLLCSKSARNTMCRNKIWSPWAQHNRYHFHFSKHFVLTCSLFRKMKSLPCKTLTLITYKVTLNWKVVTFRW